MHRSGEKYPHVLIVVALTVVCAVRCSHAQGVDSTLITPIDSATPGSPHAAGPKELWRAGLYLGAGQNLHMARGIPGLPGIPSCCPSYEQGSGSHFVAGLLGELPVTSTLRVGWDLIIGSYSGSLVTTQEEEVNADRQLVIATFEHTLSASLLGVGLETYIGYDVTRNLKVTAGLNGSYLLNRSFSQQELLASPEGITFENGKRTRLEFEGDVDQASPLSFAVAARVRYDLPITPDRTWVIAPEICAWYGLTPVIEDVPWTVHGVRIGVSLQRVKYFIPNVPTDPLDLIVPIRTGPKESMGSESETAE